MDDIDPALRKMLEGNRSEVAAAEPVSADELRALRRRLWDRAASLVNAARLEPADALRLITDEAKWIASQLEERWRGLYEGVASPITAGKSSL